MCIYIIQKSEKMNYLEDLKKIVKINSYTTNKSGVDKVGLQMKTWLENIGFSTTTYKREFIGDHLLFKSTKKTGKKILLLGHNDTVFPQDYFEKWDEDDNWIYGPGVCDMKGGNIVALQALRNIYEKNGQIFNIDFLLVSDEETGSDDSKEVSSSIAKNYDYCFVFEAAGKNLELVTSRKGVGRYIVKIDGKAAHAGTSYEKGINANLEGAIKLQKYSELMDINKGTIINVGKCEGGIGINTVSPHFEMMFEFRFDKKSEKQRVIKAVEEISNTSFVKGSACHLDGIIQRDVMEENQEQLDYLKFLEELTKLKIPKEHRGGVSDANIVSNCGVITLDGFGPYGYGDHTLKERALKSSFEQRIQMMTEILDYYQNNN
ncbi:M20 family metallopeptidase [Arcobacter roscoffensis]|uniref:M20 family metallopeptidase n=1 Tax=Arcobacter roscoffensis TaxID=2961520 RepID=A0ABY5E128_9BACT|nr:M20 family metallopeptidase [Arcobacter roscoffensis]UTJ05142.1 M20 family metallopeptidase [Arcobacter roscoffensis]